MTLISVPLFVEVALSGHELCFKQTKDYLSWHFINRHRVTEGGLKFLIHFSSKYLGDVQRIVLSRMAKCSIFIERSFGLLTKTDLI